MNNFIVQYINHKGEYCVYECQAADFESAWQHVKRTTEAFNYPLGVICTDYVSLYNKVVDLKGGGRFG